MNKNRQNAKLVAEALNECYESMLINHESVESCLARYPEQAAELAPLLQTMQAARAASSLTPDPAFRARARYEFRSALYDTKTARKSPALSWRWRWATIASTAGMLFLTSSGGLVAAATNAMPGQTLYDLKRGVENVQITLTPSQAAKARLYANLANRRVEEIVYAAQNGDAQLTEDLTVEFSNDLSLVASNAIPARNLTFAQGSKQEGAVSADNTYSGASSNAPPATTTTTATSTAVTSGSYPALAPPTTTATATTTPTSRAPVSVVPNPNPTIIITAPSNVTVTQAPAVTPVYALPQATSVINLSGISDAALLKLLQQYSVKNVAELMAILDSVSPEVRTVLLAAIEAANSGYGQLLNP